MLQRGCPEGQEPQIQEFLNSLCASGAANARGLKALKVLDAAPHYLQSCSLAFCGQAESWAWPLPSSSLHCVIVLDSPFQCPSYAVCAVYLTGVIQPCASIVAVQLSRLCVDCAVQNC